jgi:GntR family transcriptional regulator, transcriptional repressor for pyruvate dehydrogenase complex
VMDAVIERLMRRRAELEELLDYRSLLEPPVARLAASTRRNADVVAIERTLETMAGGLSEAEYMRCDTEFHTAVAAATHNRYLTHATEELRMELNDALGLLPESEAWHRRLSAEHEDIFSAIRSRDPDAAQAAAELHVRASETGVRAALAAIRLRRAVAEAS